MKLSIPPEGLIQTSSFLFDLFQDVPKTFESNDNFLRSIEMGLSMLQVSVDGLETSNLSNFYTLARNVLERQVDELKTSFKVLIQEENSTRLGVIKKGTNFSPYDGKQG